MTKEFKNIDDLFDFIADSFAPTSKANEVKVVKEMTQLDKWNDLFDNGILGMSEKECSEILCFFHGAMKTRMQIGVITMDSVIDAMRNSISYINGQTFK